MCHCTRAVPPTHRSVSTSDRLHTLIRRVWDFIRRVTQEEKVSGWNRTAAVIGVVAGVWDCSGGTGAKHHSEPVGLRPVGPAASAPGASRRPGGSDYRRRSSRGRPMPTPGSARRREATAPGGGSAWRSWKGTRERSSAAGPSARSATSATDTLSIYRSRHAGQGWAAARRGTAEALASRLFLIHPPSWLTGC